jgi:Tol biopolymer transport system component
MVDHAQQRVDNYQLIRQLGNSDWAAVYLAQALPLKTQVILKRFSWSLAASEREQFRTEARTVAGLRHPALLPLLDAGLDGSVPFLVLAYAPGGSLRRRHPQGSRLPIPVLLSYLHQLVPALQFLHEHGLLHGSIKPENMVVGEGEHLFLSEGGLALLAERKRSLLLEHGGKALAYLAPEQLRGQPEPASDQYALGVVVYEWLTGALPFHGSLQQAAAASPFLQHIVLKALASEPAQRFASVQAFVTALEDACQATPPTLGEPELPSPALLPLVPTVSLAPAPRAGSMAGTMVCMYRGHAHRVQMVAWSPDGIFLASASRDKTVQVWEATTGKQVFAYQGHTAQVHAVAWSPDGQRLASASDDGTVQVWEGGGEANPLIYRSHAPIIHTLAWSPDGIFIASDNAHQVEVWNAFTGWLRLTYPQHAYGVNALAWSPNGKYLASASNDHTVQIWDPTSGNTVFISRHHTAEVLAVAWSPEGKWLASASADRRVQIWGGSPVVTLCRYSGHTAAVNAVTWSPDGRQVASASDDGTVQVWEAATGKSLFLYQGHARLHTRRVNTVAWSPHGRYLASASDDGTVHVWEAP